MKLSIKYFYYCLAYKQNNVNVILFLSTVKEEFTEEDELAALKRHHASLDVPQSPPRWPHKRKAADKDKDDVTPGR